MKYIFVHGLGQNASSWDKTKECLADKLEMVIPELSELIREGIVLIVKCTPHFVNTVMPFQIRFIFADSRLAQFLL